MPSERIEPLIYWTRDTTMEPRLRVACPFVWDGNCRAWGTRYPTSHGCRLDPEHDGAHICACGRRNR